MIRRKKTQDIESEKIKIYKAMMISTNHVLKNFLNQLQLFKITAEDTKNFPPEILNIYNDNMRDVQKQIEALGSIANVTETNIIKSVSPK
ncbi:MAG: hypothetical protein HN790_16140 [Methylococcales bacterium]|nr:hypothetical protein [Methylococcales bacterium]